MSDLFPPTGSDGGGFGSFSPSPSDSGTSELVSFPCLLSDQIEFLRFPYADEEPAPRNIADELHDDDSHQGCTGGVGSRITQPQDQTQQDECIQ